MSIYDLLILGGGPAGLTAGIYGARAKLKTVILEKGAVGGMAFTTREIVNYPSYKSITGPNLTKTMANHAQEFGAEIIKCLVTEVELDGEIKTIKTKKGNQYQARAVILALGSQPRLLNIPGERRLRGNGVSYCATCDAEFYEGLTVIVVGNGDAAIEEAIYITKYASKVIVIVIHDEGIVDCNKASAEKAFKNEKMDFIWNSVLAEIKGSEDVEAVVIQNLKTGEHTEVKAEGVFIYVGMVPETEFLQSKVDLDDRGYIVTNEMMETSVDGVCAAGDARVKYLRQVVTAANDGAVAAVTVERYLAEEDDFKENVLNANKPVLLAFWSPVDEESIHAVTRLEKTVAESGHKVRLVKVDMSRKKRIAQRYNVTSTRAALLLKEGKVIRDISGDILTFWDGEV
ncbi:thioredoxin-disulfide reductase [Desulfosporosinus fructosivorans]|uniref:Thioredoxin reductase n=1 Tax=Desulfosporosinus fructosivorans TaxID=2018669 RepID=A0A4Z0R2R9_9FIRM|nr:thioredoxin-disulfide reductase [Desulfosporosinus fructosivorans]TGE37372.1 thioredoxin-disulfide reductase [Desulfosporosinus fructosivorans]